MQLEHSQVMSWFALKFFWMATAVPFLFKTWSKTSSSSASVVEAFELCVSCTLFSFLGVSSKSYSIGTFNSTCNKLFSFSSIRTCWSIDAYFFNCFFLFWIWRFLNSFSCSSFALSFPPCSILDLSWPIWMSQAYSHSVVSSISFVMIAFALLAFFFASSMCMSTLYSNSLTRLYSSS